jgi:hypothetical protein
LPYNFGVSGQINSFNFIIDCRISVTGYEILSHSEKDHNKHHHRSADGRLYNYRFF